MNSVDSKKVLDGSDSQSLETSKKLKSSLQYVGCTLQC